MKWDDRSVARLRALAAERLNCVQIAAQLTREFGVNVDVKSVSRKAIRLKISTGGGRGLHHVGAANGAPDKRAAQSGGSNPGGEAAARLHDMARRLIREERMRCFEVAPPTAVKLTQLKNCHCRWPFGEPRDVNAMRYCGAPKVAGASYCAAHRALARESDAAAHARAFRKAQEMTALRREAAKLQVKTDSFAA